MLESPLTSVTSPCRLTVLIPPLERGNILNDLTWALAADGHNQRTLCQSHYKSPRKNTHKSTSDGVPRFLLPLKAWGEVSFIIGFLLFWGFFVRPELAERFRFHMLSCGAWFAWQVSFWACWAVDANQQGGNFQALEDCPHWAEKQSLRIRKERWMRGK